MKKHNPRVLKNKKGAIELSMTTIIVVIIGVTFLTLGIKLVYDYFQDIEEQRVIMNDATQKRILELFGESEDSLNLMQTSTEIEQGKDYQLNIGIKNTLSQKHTFVYEIEVFDVPGTADAKAVEDWFISTAGAPIELESGEVQPEPIKIKVPKDGKIAPLGSYLIRINLDCKDCDLADSRSFIFEVV